MAVFRRRLSGVPDYLPGYARLSHGKGNEPVVTQTGNANDRVAGLVFTVTENDLDLAARAEPLDYVRRSVVLASGRNAWAFLKR
ncbi:MAG: gamma-glutamylcyclotransferase [Rhizobiaceae bacterium]